MFRVSYWTTKFTKNGMVDDDDDDDDVSAPLKLRPYGALQICLLLLLIIIIIIK